MYNSHKTDLGKAVKSDSQINLFLAIVKKKKREKTDFGCSAIVNLYNKNRKPQGLLALITVISYKQRC